MLAVKPPSVAAAARNNAEWCDLMCRAHGTGGTFGAHTWSTPVRSPRFYPDAVTLDAEARVDDLLTRVDTGTGCSCKDSFASLDLTPAGFRVLFDAEWIFHPPAPVAPSHEPSTWVRITDPGELSGWEAAWAGSDDAASLFHAEILDDPNVLVLCDRADGAIVDGAIFNRAANVVGVSNAFSCRGDLDATWTGVTRAAHTYFPNEVIVGYESGADLAAARHHEFVALGPLRVWVND